MDKHSEVEIKFEADRVALKHFHEFVVNLTDHYLPPEKSIYIHSYKTVRGTDTYFTLHGQVLRFRAGGDRESELTYKQRKSSASIIDRVEVNLPFKTGVSSYDVRTLLGYLGAEQDFTINKDSYIYHVQGRESAFVYQATVALYDVEDQDHSERRFLEVEIETDSACASEEGLKALDSWKRLIQNRLPVSGPLNKSLYEMYTRKGNSDAKK